MPAMQGMQKPPLTRGQSSSELRNMWALLAERDLATDSSAAGIKAQAERGKGNGETTAQLGVTHSCHIPSGFGRTMTVPKQQQRLPARAGAGVAVRMMMMMMMQGGARRAEAARGGFVTASSPGKTGLIPHPSCYR